MTSPLKIAFFGGTFNPVHTGHLLVAEAAKEKLGLDRLLFLPAGIPPHKKAPRTSSRDRLAMLCLAVKSNKHFEVSPWEVQQKRVVYTYQTMDHFRKKWPKARLYFIVGSDSMKKLPHWRESRRLRTLCRFVSYDRLAPFASHAIRLRVRQGRSIRYLVPDAVERYIRQHRLYRRPE